MTSKALDQMKVPYRLVIEEQEYSKYITAVPKSKLLVLDKAYQENYDTFDKLGDTKSKGPGAARNFIWDHSISEGYSHHWVMDDNIKDFRRLNKNERVIVEDGTIFKCMEDFCLRYINIAMAGPQYYMFALPRNKIPPFVLNTRIYSCNFIRNDVPFRWRGRYNEDTDLSLRMLKAGWCTVQFNAFLQHKTTTQAVKGGNTQEFYAEEGTYPKSKMQVDMHPDVSRLTWRFGRVHHYVNYKPFQKNKLKRRSDIVIESGVNNYGMELKDVTEQNRKKKIAEKINRKNKKKLKTSPWTPK